MEVELVTMKSSPKPLFNEEESSAPDELATVIVEDAKDEVVIVDSNDEDDVATILEDGMQWLELLLL